MKKSKVVIPALGLIALSTAASITGTVAWFSANQRVEIRGMQVKTKVSSNLLVAADTIGSTAKLADNLFDTGLNQYIRGILEPVSTVNGQDFFYTTNAKADGDAKADTYVEYGTEAELTGEDATNYADPFSKAYGIKKTDAAALFPVDSPNYPTAEQGAKPYVDYVFQLKAVNAENANRDLKISALTLTYTAASAEADENKAYRVAIDVQKNIATSAPTASFTSIATGIFAPSTAANHSDAGGKNYAVSAVDAAPTQLSVTGNKYNNTNLGVLDTIAAGDTQYYKITARLYLEGEDTTCTNETFAALTGQWALALDCVLDSTTAAVTALTIA